MDLSSQGIAVDIPQGWDGEIYRRPSEIRPLAERAEVTKPVLHLGNFPLPPQRGDFGSGAVEIMRSDDILIVLFEYGSESAGTALFSAEGIPQVAADDFATHTLQRPMRNQSGAQYFFHSEGRAFCLYVVLGSHARRNELIPEVNHVLGSLSLADV